MMSAGAHISAISPFARGLFVSGQSPPGLEPPGDLLLVCSIEFIEETETAVLDAREVHAVQRSRLLRDSRAG